jgi:hypothetical protein
VMYDEIMVAAVVHFVYRMISVSDMFKVGERVYPSRPLRSIKSYSLRPIILFANTDVSITKMCLDTSILAKSNMGRREYQFILDQSI